jgi:hypothetical protein
MNRNNVSKYWPFIEHIELFSMNQFMLNKALEDSDNQIILLSKSIFYTHSSMKLVLFEKKKIIAYIFY